MEKDDMTLVTDTQNGHAEAKPWPYIEQIRRENDDFLKHMRVARVAVRSFIDNPESGAPWLATEITEGVMSMVADDDDPGFGAGHAMIARDELVSDGDLIPTWDARFKPKRRRR